MIASHKEMLGLPNFGHMAAPKMSFEAYEKNLMVTSWTEIMAA